jgi:CRISPR-associated protein Cas5h
MDTLSFRWRGRFGHFLRAEANANALTYPLPPRTAVLGLLAAILGLEKDALAQELAATRVAIAGAPPTRFWHRAKLRKDPPVALPQRVRLGQGRSESAPEKATLNRQEWLLKPDFLVTCALPERPGRFAELTGRVRERRWHFGPCMGLSELLAEVTFVALDRAEPLPAGEYRSDGACPADRVRLLPGEDLGVQLLRMPHGVDAERVFAHRGLYLEHRGRPFRVHTDAAWRVGERVVCFL